MSIEGGHRHFHDQLDALKRTLIDMSEKAERLVELSVEALLEHDAGKAQAVIAGDKALDALSRVEPVGVEFASALRDPGFDAMRRDARFRRVTSGERLGPEAVPQSGRSGKTRE